MHMDMHRTVVAGLLVATIAGCNAVDPNRRAIAHFVQAQLLIEQEELDSALIELNQAVKCDPERAVAYTTAGDIHRRRSEYELARFSYEMACKTNPYAFRAHYNLGVTYQLLAAATDLGQRIEELFILAVVGYFHPPEPQPGEFATPI